MIKHVIVIDESSVKSIEAQNTKITNGVTVDQTLTLNVKNIVEPILAKHYCILKKYYGDAFYSRELVRFKFVIEPLSEPLKILEELKEALIVKFKIRKLTYLEEDDGSSNMILVWM